MALNWKALAPHRPLDPGEAGYVVPPSRYADRVARLIDAGTTTVLVGGPVGVGKSTELARLAALLQGPRIACFLRLDRLENVRRLTPDQLLGRIAGELVSVAHTTAGLPISDALRTSLVEAGLLDPSLDGQHGGFASSFSASGATLAQAAIAEVARLSPDTRIVFILDGLEKMPETPEASEVLATFERFDDAVDIVVVVPWFVAFGAAEDRVRPGALFVPMSAPVVDGALGHEGHEFLFTVLAQRLGLPRHAYDPSAVSDAPAAAHEPLVRLAFQRRKLLLGAAYWSGGLPRIFLQLMADAAQYAQIRRGDDWPNEQDLADAVADQRDSFRRALLPGDTQAIRLVEGTDGREMELARKIRLLARGIILERQQGERWVMNVHPLVKPLLGDGSRA